VRKGRSWARAFAGLFIFVILVAGSPGAAAPFGRQSSPDQRVDCREWHECRQLALDALGRGAYEQFHDLAWRAVQTGPRRDPDLMYLLARAQSLSGRLHDALVMLGRLAATGIAADALSNDDFRLVRALSGWPEVEAAIRSASPDARAAAGAAAVDAPAPAPVVAAAAPEPATTERASVPSKPSGTVVSGVSEVPVTPAAPGAPGAAAAPPRRTEDAMRLTAANWSPTGVAYDRVSARFVLADRGGRKLLSIDERSRHLVDLVGPESAGFYEITALEIDGRRGDLWVVSANPSTTEGQPATVLHKLQLVSGRPLSALPLPDTFGPARFDDVAVSPRGTVFILDGLGKRLFRLPPGSHDFTVAAELAVDQPTSLAPVDDRIVYIAHRKGIARLDTSTRGATPLRGPKNVPLENFDRIRWALNRLVGVQRLPDGTRRVVSARLTETPRRPRVRALDVVESNVVMTDPMAASLADDAFYFLVRDPDHAEGDAEIVVRRARLR
jgi:hypothetical protein